MDRERLAQIVVEALQARGGSASVVEVAKYVWDHYEAELRGAGSVFYTWQYDVRRAAETLRNRRVMMSADISPRGIWQLS